jgi:RNA polymerase sigma factor (sigma-70 family)
MSNRPDREEVTDYKAWFEKNEAGLFRNAYFVTWDRGIAEDIAQEAAIKIFKSWADETQREKILGSWSYVARVVLNCYLDFKKVKSRTNEREEEFTDERLNVEAEPGSGLEVRQALLHLPERERDMLFLTYYSGLTKTEAGRQLGISPSSASRLHQRALRSLETLLGKEED